MSEVSETDISGKGEEVSKPEYSMSDAVRDAESMSKASEPVKEKASEPVKEKASEPVKEKASEPVKEKASEPVKAQKSEDDETRKAVEFYRNMGNPQYQEMVYKQLSQVFQKPSEASPKPQQTSEEKALDDLLASLDPDVKRAFEALADKKVSVISQRLESWEKSLAEKEATVRRSQVQKEFEEFLNENKDDVKKYEKEMLALGQKYPDLLRGGKDGLKRILSMVSEEDRISERVAKEVEKALLREKEVVEKVKRFSAHNTPATSSPAKKGVYSWKDAFDDAMSTKTVSV